MRQEKFHNFIASQRITWQFKDNWPCWPMTVHGHCKIYTYLEGDEKS